ncbi:MAG: radical SAM protein [Ruminococcaceae bacterium]|nr:radical SAM protein [Oscillospiraceae bacterium]
MKIRILHRGFNFSQDGPGNRLVYHLQGCNFFCPWCSNPESIAINGTEMISDGKKKLSCTEHDTEEIFAEILSGKMMMFSGGGVTFTGGEPTVQFEALKELLMRCKEAGINTAIESNASHPEFCELSELIDYMIVDLKHYDAEKHKSVIGTSNEKTIENIRKVTKMRDQLLIHIPLVGKFNSSAEDADNFARLIKSFANDKIDVEVLRYHEYGKDKWAQCGMEYRMNDAHVTDEEYTQFIDVLKKNGISIIKT